MEGNPKKKKGAARVQNTPRTVGSGNIGLGAVWGENDGRIVAQRRRGKKHGGHKIPVMAFDEKTAGRLTPQCSWGPDVYKTNRDRFQFHEVFDSQGGEPTDWKNKRTGVKPLTISFNCSLSNGKKKRVYHNCKGTCLRGRTRI